MTGYKYNQEAGAIISENDEVLHLVDGNPGSVDFPEHLIWAIHCQRPGAIFKLAHTHPTGMTELSGRDKQTLKTWAFALYPFPIRMSTLTMLDYTFVETSFFAKLESKDSWRERGGGARKFEIVTERVSEVDFSEVSWRPLLVSRSYSI